MTGRTKLLKTKTIFILLVLAVFQLTIYAQNKNEELITDRPDQTESSAVVPFKSLQIESGFLLENDESEFFKNRYYAYNTSLLRYGLFDNFELRLGLEYLEKKILQKYDDKIIVKSGLSPLYLGFKVKIVDEHNWKPEIAFLGGLILPFTANEFYKTTYTASNFRFSFGHTLSKTFSLGYNFGVEWDGESAIPNYFYSLALGIGATEKIGIFIESFGLLNEECDQEHLLDAGLTYLLLPNLQIDLSAGIGINKETIDNFISFGLSVRIPD